MLRGWRRFLAEPSLARPRAAASILFYCTSTATTSPELFASQKPRKKRERIGKAYPVNEDDIRKHRAFCERFAQEHGFGDKMEGWYAISTDQFCANPGGTTIISNYYKCSPLLMLSTLFPEHKWECWRFSRVSKGCWNKMENQRAKMDEVAGKLGIKRLDDWYAVSCARAVEAGAGGLLTLAYGSSLRRGLRAIYPEHEWLEWKFSRVADGWFYKPGNARQCVDWIGAQLGVRKLEDWYQFRQEDILSHIKPIIAPSGKGQLGMHDLLRLAYPEHKWIDWKFKSGVPIGFWDDVKNHRLFCDWAAEQLGIQHPTDWLKVTSQDFIKVGGVTLLTNVYCGSMNAMIRTVYQEYPWDAEHKQ